MPAKYKVVPHLFQHWDDVAKRVRESRHLLIFLDFDGTLVPIAPRPDMVRVDAVTRRVLHRLGKRRRVTLAVISGRRREELQQFIPDRHVRYLGLYGWERNGRLELSSVERVDIAHAHGLLIDLVREHPKLWIEAKDISLSVHLRDVKPAAQPRVRKAVRRILSPFRRSLHMFENILDIEIVPHSIRDKGAAVLDFLAKPAMRHDLPFFFGDDFSDEPAFAAVKKGVSVLVGKPRPTHAQFHLHGPDEVTKALVRLEEELQS
jgi:trehalose 6-phosphate phosphatase